MKTDGSGIGVSDETLEASAEVVKTAFAELLETELMTGSVLSRDHG